MKIALYALVHAKSLQPCPTLCNPMDCSPPVHGILQASILEWAAMPFSRGSSWLRDATHASCSSSTAGRFFTAEPPGRPISLYKTILSTNNNCKCYAVGKAKSNLRKWFQIKLTNKYDCESYLKWITDPNVKANITTFKEENIEIIVTLKQAKISWNGQ